MKRKIIITSLFLALILATATIFLVGAIESYNYDMDPKNGVDILEGFGAAILIGVGIISIFYEIDLFVVVYYFFCAKRKTVKKTVLNLLANGVLLLTFLGCDFLGNLLHRLFSPSFHDEELIVLFALGSIYALLRIAYLLICVGFDEEESLPPR